jgi:hypothetical protein
MSKSGENLDESTLAKTFFSIEDLKAGQFYEGIISDINFQNSRPI